MIAQAASGDVSGYAVLIGAVATVLGAMGAVLKIILSHQDESDTRHADQMEKQDARHDAALREQRKGFETFLGNHMSGNTRALQEVTRQLEELTKEVKRR